MPPTPAFPQNWLDLLVAYSDLGSQTPELIHTIEATVAGRERLGSTVFPPNALRYAALEHVTPDNCAVVIAGQDPYHGLAVTKDGTVVPEAMGLSFSVPRGVPLPPSLRNIYQEMVSDLGLANSPSHGDLTSWARQGVLLLNTVLTVDKDLPKSHDKLGWQAITRALVQALSRKHAGLVFVLWGGEAKKLLPKIDAERHTVLTSSHPSPLFGACHKGFFGSRPFSNINRALAGVGRSPIDWNLA